VNGPLRLCFVAPNAWPILARARDIPFAGGSEVQQATLAREFARRGHAVSMVCLDFGQPDDVVIDGVKVYRAHAPQAGVPVLRFVHPRFTSVWSAMRRADADVYYQRNAGALTGFVVAFARRHGRVAVYAAASDADFDPALPMIAFARDRAIFRWGVRHAHALVAQHPAQRRACRDTFDRESCVIRSAYAHAGSSGRHDGDILWVGAVKPIKAPERFVELARACPRWKFRMIGTGEPGYVAAIHRQARDVPNLVFGGFVPHADIESHFDGASLLVNTSPTEGFPNTFLQAWSRGIPTASFVDPGLGWNGRPAGCVARSVAEMAAIVDKWKSDPAAWAEAGDACRRTHASTFSADAVIQQYETLFRRLRRARPAGPVSVGDALR
jgi:glycosyltransferase involved in cell wall biosynthesis